MCCLAAAIWTPALAGANTARPHAQSGARVGAAALRRSRLLARYQHFRQTMHLRGAAPRARAAIAGGHRINVSEAPWAVHIEALIVAEIGGKEVPTEILYCSGSILDESHVLTAGHCLFNHINRKPIPPRDIFVVAGTSNFLLEPSEDPEEQVALASETRVHPYFSYDPEATRAIPDDVAVLKLAEPLVLRPSARPIALVAPGTLLLEGIGANLAGFGEQSVEPPKLSGALYALATTLDYSRECGGEADALFLCASSPSGSLCLGDSGGGLTEPGSPASLIGVADTVEVIERQPCRAGADNGFANLAAPEIRDFIEGSKEPPRAPRGQGAEIHGFVEIGSSLTCEPGSWTGHPAYTYAFIDTAHGKLLQLGASPAFTLSAADVGGTILCEVFATNAGGTGIGRTEALPPLQGPGGQSAGNATGMPRLGVAAARESRTLLLAGSRISVRKNGVALVKIRCLGDSRCHGKLTLITLRKTRNGHGRAARIVIGRTRVSLAHGRTATIKLRLSPTGLSLLAAGHGYFSALLSLVGSRETAPTQPHSMSVHLVERHGNG